MKKSVFFLIAFVIFQVSFLSDSNAQRGRTDNSAEMNEFKLKAKEVGEEIGLLLPAVQKVREAAARSFANTLVKAQKLANEVDSLGNLTAASYKRYQSMLSELELQLDDHRVGGGSTSQTEPKPGTQGECFKSCDDAYGKGFGGGKGWNRFWCKASCIKINIGG